MKSGDTVVKSGYIYPQWLQKQTPVLMDTNSTDLDYLYITIYSQQELTEENFQLEFGDKNFASSTFKIEKITKNGKNSRLYSIRINYKCKNYGGKLIRYNFTIKGNFKECENQKTTIYWDRICGDPRQNRKGLIMEYDFAHKYNQTVVQEGLLKDASYFDQDLENFVFKIPSKFTYSIFYIYMVDTKNELNDKNFSDEDLEKFVNNKDSTKLDVLQSILELIPVEEISSPQLNYDEQILQPVLKGDLVNGGTIGNVRITMVKKQD
ncbi:hypothetical protein IMG5_187670 [Ichthyophthirius multifiliis]|uniref:Uncharacterized protein n=1 Tax=Ichthyophthirius multifiliis TaxID=5932 RepID=G0R3V5_ICHMU|nr:hypothetical protein IMG5_187670 [Ichthyophthirius multifiliis]EGR27862.1 hypothetical protein IMG5_187670 [Ichthyophthirius multifiliis]|eukprot:XP_004027207.1 hypothetical protein IMG5_187670 [Ichthyophthirius multifiliis]